MQLTQRLAVLTRDWSVRKKLIVGQAVLILALLGAYSFYVATYCGALLGDNYISDMKRQVTLAKGIFEVYDHAITGSTDKLAADLKSYFPARFDVDARRTVKVGGMETPVVLYGGSVLNNNFTMVDRFTKTTGAVATIFVRSGDDFVRVSTSLKKENGARAIGTTLGKNHPGYSVLIGGESYLGHANLFGRDYSTKYMPIKGATGQVVAILFVGVDTTEATNFMKKQIKAIKIANTGYIYALDAEEGEHQGMLLIHPYEEGKNILSSKSVDGREFTKEMIRNREGTTHYEWMNAEVGDKTARAKTVVYTYYDKRKLVIAAGAYDDEIFAQAVKLRYILMVATALIIGTIIALLYVMTQRVVIKPLKEAVDFAEIVAGGNLTTALPPRGADELGILGDALNRMVGALKEMVAKIGQTSSQVASAANDISANTAHLATAAHSQSAATEETSATMAQMAAFIQTVAANAESLAGNAIEVSSSIEELGASGEEIAKNAETMASSVAEVSATIEQMTRSIIRMSGHNDELQKVMAESSSTIEELARSITEAANSVEAADAVAKSAAQEASAGEKAINEALAGMLRVGQVIGKTAAALSSLDRRSAKIGNIVEVIGDIAEQSNLLALNASIQAAQAGEAGQGFAVVAEEMRTLATQSAEAVNEITRVINEVQADTEDSVKYGELAAAEAQTSMELSRTAGKSLANIVHNIEQTTALMTNIARMTAEQAAASNNVILAVEKMTRASEVVAKTAQEQAAGSGQIKSSAELMNDLTRMVAIATKEQSLAAKQITQTVHAMNAMTHRVANATAEQKAGVSVVVSAVGNISELTLGNLASVEQLSQATQGLSQQAVGLAGLIEEFRVR